MEECLLVSTHAIFIDIYSYFSIFIPTVTPAVPEIHITGLFYTVCRLEYESIHKKSIHIFLKMFHLFLSSCEHLLHFFCRLRFERISIHVFDMDAALINKSIK